jgi:hypothetical protein
MVIQNWKGHKVIIKTEGVKQMSRSSLLRLAINLTLIVASFSACSTPMVTPEPISPTAISPSVVTTTTLVPPTPESTSTSAVTPTPEPSYLILQAGNSAPKLPLQSKPARELADNRIGHIVSDFWHLGLPNESWVENDISNLGAKRIRLSINEADSGQVDWSRPELEVESSHDDTITDIAAQGITVTYRLQFWDKAYHASGGQVTYPRFKTEDQILRYLDFVRFIVRHFKDRVQYYEIWNEPACEGLVQCIEVDDYINLVRRAAPVIHEEYPEAKIVVGSIAGLDTPEIRAYLFKILESDIMPLADVVTWHPLFSSSPEYNKQYYYDYPAILQQIKDTASAHGFKGEYMAEELVYQSPDCTWCNPSDYLYSNIVAAKYYARGIMLHLGMDISVGVAGNSHVRQQSFIAIRNLCTIMAGAKPKSLSIEIQSQAANIKSNSFSLPNGDRLVALWTDGVAVDQDPGVKTTLIIRGISAQGVIGMDILNNFEQRMLTSKDGGNLVIRDLFVKDYPIILRFTE